jgi:putative ATP-dependent DNA ligase
MIDDLPVLSGALGLSERKIRELNKRNILVDSFIEEDEFYSGLRRLYRFDKDSSSFEKGTVIAITEIGTEVARGFPKIRRAMMLKPALKKHFSKKVIVEEKMNGYNTRIVSFNKNMYALTRGGFICPYTTEVARDRINESFFKDYSDYQLCTEAVGPDNPYVPKEIYGVHSLEFFVFDIMEKNTGKLMSYREKERIAEEYGLSTVHNFGEFSVDEGDSILEIVKKLGKEGREGVVIKDPEARKPPIKYTSSESNCADLHYAFTFFNDYGQSFVFSRVVREAFQSVEMQETEDQIRERCLRVGESIIRPMVESIYLKKQGERIAEQSTLQVKSLKTLDLFERYLRRMGVRAIFSRPERWEKGFKVKIEKVMWSTDDKIGSILSGDLW